MTEETNVFGFYKIPNFSRYGLSKAGGVINLNTLRLMKTQKHPRGYIRYVLMDDSGQSTSVARHRLLAIVFIPTSGDICELMVNHKNLIPGDDRIENLEWCTHAENMKHAVLNNARRGKIRVECRNTFTDEITIYSDRGKCACAIGLSKYQLEYRLLFGPERIYPDGYQFRVFGDTRTWGDPAPQPLGRLLGIDVRSHLTGEVFFFESQRNAALFFEVCEASISNWISDKNQPIVEKLLQFKKPCEEWRSVKNAILEYSQNTFLRPVAVIDEDDLTLNLFLSAKRCAFVNSINATTLNYRLSSKGERVFSDGKRYIYYSDYVNSKWSAIVRNPIVNFP